jgi:transcriptional regulator with XRE-family HTH domain
MSFEDIAARLRKHSDQKASAAPRNFDELYLLRARILGVLIRDARLAADASIEACAMHVGVNVDTFSRWEFGKSMPALPQLELLAYHLNVPISHFWGTETLEHQTTQKSVDPDEYITLRGRLIGALLRAAREQNNLTPEQLADETGIQPAHITAYELGQRPIPVPILVTLAQALKVNLSYFLEDGSRVSQFLTLQEDLKYLAEMPDEMRHFVASPVNQAYIDLAMKLARMSSSELRSVAEAILEITL